MAWFCFVLLFVFACSRTIDQILRVCTKERICGDNFESWKQMFSKDSLLLYLIQERKQYINRKDVFLPLISENVPVLEINSAKQLREFYRFHGL